MYLLNEIHNQFSVVEKENIKRGKVGISEVCAKSPFKLPDDYISFLECISGENGSGVCLEADGWCPLVIYSAEEALNKMQDYELYADDVWIIGDDMGMQHIFTKKTKEVQLFITKMI